MDPISQARFDSLRKTDQANWTDADREFMTARRGYLPADEVKVLSLEPSPSKAPTIEPPSEPSAEPAKAGKKK